MILDHVGFASLSKETLNDCPVLAAALEHVQPIDDLDCELDGQEQHAQLFRTYWREPLNHTEKYRKKYLVQHLRDIERWLRYGRAFQDQHIRGLGGLVEFDCFRSGDLALGVYRDLCYREYEDVRYGYGGERLYPDYPQIICEWLSEITLLIYEKDEGERVAA